MKSCAERDESNNVSENCRVCDKMDNYANLFLNNKELQKNLNSLIQTEINESDGLSKWLCRECFEKVEDFTRKRILFLKKYLETSNKVLSIRNASLSPSPMMKNEPEFKQETYEVEALDETFEDILSPDELVDPQVDIMVEELNLKQESHLNEELKIKMITSVFDCDICSKIYLSKNSLNRHRRTAHEMMRFTCPMCSSKFTQKTSLNEHIKNLHNAISSHMFACRFSEECNRIFNTAKMLDQHMKYHATGHKKKQTEVFKVNKKYRKQCSTCGLFFKHIEEHKLTHQTENTFHCQHPECNKKFKFNTSLQAHLRIHNNERKFECHKCNKKFRLSHHLKEHLTIHTKEKNFVCDICPKKFASKLNLYKHSKLHLKESNK